MKALSARRGVYDCKNIADTLDLLFIPTMVGIAWVELFFEI